MLLLEQQEGNLACKELSGGVLAGMVTCLRQCADLDMVQVMPLPLTVSCSRKSRLVLPECFSFLVPAYPGCPGKNAVKRM